jgi:protoheme IX farnesyltransferase
MSTSTLAYPDRAARWISCAADYIAMTKLRIGMLVLVVVAVVAEVAAWGQLSPWLLCHLLAGTLLVSASASSANQLRERHLDGRMPRTASRPLAAGRVSPRAAFLFSLMTGVLGTTWLTLNVNGLTAVLGIACWLIYVVVYTPLKTRSPYNTLVGAIAGAFPVLMAWAATGASWNPQLDVRWLALFMIVFLWQFPHFMAIAWLYRDQYEQAGMKMWTVVDPSGRRPAVIAVLAALALLPVSFIPGLYWSATAGSVYLLVAFTLAVGQLVLAVRFFLCVNDQRARLLLWASLVYLPVLLVSMIAIPLVF